MKLEETVRLMESGHYKDRFIAEYLQAKIRYEKLRNTLVKYDAGTLDILPNCEVRVLKDQLQAMDDYIYALEVRAEQEDIEL